MSFHRWTHKLVYIHRLKYYSAINKNKPSIPIQHQWISQELCQVKEAISKYYTVYGAFYVTVWKRQMHKEWRSSSGCHRPGEGEGRQQRISMREFIPFVKLFLYHQDFLSLFFFFKGFIYLFLERGKRRRKRGRETLMWERNIEKPWPVASHKHFNKEVNPQPRVVPWLGIELVTCRFPGWCPTNWATLVRARVYFL